MLSILKAILLYVETCGQPTDLPQHDLAHKVQIKSNALIAVLPFYHPKVEKAIPDINIEERALGVKRRSDQNSLQSLAPLKIQVPFQRNPKLLHSKGPKDPKKYPDNDPKKDPKSPKAPPSPKTKGGDEKPGSITGKENM